MEKLLAEEKELELTKFSNEDAFELGKIVIELVKSKYPNKFVTISIEKNKNKIFYYKMDWAREDFDYWIKGKRNCVERFNHSSLYLKEYAASKDYDFYERYNLDKNLFRLDGGGYPISIKETGIIGNICISGITSYEDHNLCVESLKIFKEKNNQ